MGDLPLSSSWLSSSLVHSCLLLRGRVHLPNCRGPPQGPPLTTGEPSLKSQYQNTLSLTVQVTNHAGHGPSRGTQTAHRDDPLRSPLERAPPRSRAHSPSGGLRPVRGTNPPSSGSAPARGLTPPRASRASLEGPSRPRPGPATLTGVPHACAGPVRGHLTP
jgi:hypothetical protein